MPEPFANGSPIANGSLVCKVGDDPREPIATMVVMSVDVAGRTALCEVSGSGIRKVIDVVRLQPVTPPPPEDAEDVLAANDDLFTADGFLR